jgi:hypothetical protein
MLKASGSGLPQPVLNLFDQRFAEAMRSAHRGGTGKWRDGTKDVDFTFYLTDDIIRDVKGADWAEAALGTAAGTKVVAAVGGKKDFNARIDAAVPRLVTASIAASRGEYHGTETFGWLVLTESAPRDVAHRGKHDFKPYDIFYMISASKVDAAKIYKSANRLLVDHWNRKHKEPIDGPYF